MAETYTSRGVSPSKDDVKAAVKGQDKGLFPGAFCKIVPDLAGDPDFCMALHADGAGTKAALAYLIYRETGDIEVFRGIAQDSLVMNTDDLACIGASSGFYLSNTLGRNAQRVGGEVIATIIQGYDDCLSALAQQGIAITMTGGETADVGDLVSTLIVDSTISCRLPRNEVISTADLKPGLAIVGLSATGQATYETKANSGMGSNGLTAARHLLLHHDYFTQYPETYASSLAEDKVYGGPYHVTDQLPGSAMTVGAALLSPTRTYLPVIHAMLALYREQIQGIIHCTGGGQVKCRDFGRDILYVKDNLFPVPALFAAIYATDQVPAREMYQIFNMGHRMEVYCAPELAPALCSLAESFAIEARVIGHTEESEVVGNNEVLISSPWGEFFYR